MLDRESRKERVRKQYTWTHNTIPEEDNRDRLRELLENNQAELKELRTFLKTVNIRQNRSCYESE